MYNLDRIENYNKDNKLFSEETSLLRTEINKVIIYYEKKINKIKKELEKKEYKITKQQTSPKFDFILAKDIKLRVNVFTPYKQEYNYNKELISISIAKTGVSDLDIEFNLNNTILVSYNPTHFLINARIQKKYKSEMNTLLKELGFNDVYEIRKTFITNCRSVLNKIDLSSSIDNTFWDSTKFLNDFFAINDILNYKNPKGLSKFEEEKTDFPFNNIEKLKALFEMLSLQEDYIIPENKRSILNPKI